MSSPDAAPRRDGRPRSPLCHSYSPSSHKEQKVCQPLCHISAAQQSFFPLLFPLGISCVTPFHIILCRRLLYSLPHHPQLSRVPSTPAEWRNSLQQSTYRGGTWILSTYYILSLLVILLLASIVQQLCSFRGVQRCRLPTAGRISVSAFCNPALAVCQSESEWVWG